MAVGLQCHSPGKHRLFSSPSERWDLRPGVSSQAPEGEGRRVCAVQEPKQKI